MNSAAVPNGQQKKSFEKLVKIRIGEPLTAVEVLLGAISGYVGVYDTVSKETYYAHEVFEEIIRGINVTKTGQVQISVGDHSVVTVDVSSMKLKERYTKSIFASHAAKSASLCASTMAFLSKSGFIAMTVAHPTQNKDAVVDAIDGGGYKGSLQVFDIANQSMKSLGHFSLPTVSVPFDFDGDRLVWLEFQQKGKKDFGMYHVKSLETTSLFTFDKSVDFVSHVKLAGQFIIYVENHKHVKALNIESKQVSNLYSHKDIIEALSVSNRGIIDEEIEGGKGENKKKPMNLDDLVIHSVDFGCVYKQFSANKLSHTIAVLNLDNVPDLLKKHSYLFDMGYPYYISSRDNVVAFTTDFGLCIIRI